MHLLICLGRLLPWPGGEHGYKVLGHTLSTAMAKKTPLSGLERESMQAERYYFVDPLGFYHEQTRSDRDEYVKINWENMSPDMAYNFQKQNTNNQKTPYDYGSIMHYGRTAFSIQPGLETITPIPDETVEIGQRQGMSNTDILRINKLYGC
ncbi:high choriolytic enzyme 1-like [Sinocyclocheilus grahami]|uniref:high choriolytic enzyme 1-like n=1 Tax=Sinocyclocheilus grahami TaxID=75366 RepID=UPI0007AC832D|nr:PREDICTED: high choriolytic enzyme 1-like [Sinocyclocheilus grahami]